MRVELEVNYSVGWEPEPCPNWTHPLHHLVHSPWLEGVARNGSVLGKAEKEHEILAFECSSPTCSAAILVRFRPPVLTDEHIRLLTDEALLNQRAEEVMISEPARFEGHKKPTPADVLSDLRTYLRNSIDHQESRPIKVENKRFALKFGIDGQACKDVLNFLGFKYYVCVSFRLTGAHELTESSYSTKSTGYLLNFKMMIQRHSRILLTFSSMTLYGKLMF